MYNLSRNNSYFVVAMEYLLTPNNTKVSANRASGKIPIDLTKGIAFNGDEPIDFEDETGVVPFFFQKDYAHAVADSVTDFANRTPVKRIFYSLNGKYLLLVGVPWSWLNSAPAGDLIIDPTTNVTNSDDTYLQDATNFGSNTALVIGKSTGSYKKRTLIKFNITGVPSNATALNAQMKLRYYGVTGGSWIDRWVQTHQLLRHWREGEADSLKRRNGSNWLAPRGKIGPGSDSTLVDANGQFESTVLFQAGEYPVWKIWDLTALTQKWINGTATNYGVILWANYEENGMNLWFRSSEYSDPTYRPQLEITYSTELKTVYFLKDHLGSIRAAVLDSTGAPVIGFDDYDPWGYVLASRTKPIPNAYLQGASKSKFTGKDYDDDYGVNWLHFDWRPYDPLIGRLLSVDPQAADSPSHSPYQYAYNNPLAFNDPTGQSAEAVVEKDSSGNETGNVIVSANLIFYGSQATEQTAAAIVNEIQNVYNSAGATITINGKQYTVKFNITSQVVSAGVASILAQNNTDIKNNFIRVENQGTKIRSEVDKIGGNAGFFVTSDNLGRSTTAAHEFGHGLGLPHSPINQIGRGQPNIMAARGTLVDPQFQYNPNAQPDTPGGTLNPIFRAVLQRNISDVFINVHFTNGIAKIGTLTNTIYK